MNNLEEGHKILRDGATQTGHRTFHTHELGINVEIEEKNARVVKKNKTHSQQTREEFVIGFCVNVQMNARVDAFVNGCGRSWRWCRWYK